MPDVIVDKFTEPTAKDLSDLSPERAVQRPAGIH
jgi:hypothetical protein